MVDRTSLDMQLPVTIGDYVDGYGGLHHAVTCGRIFRDRGAAPDHRRSEHHADQNAHYGAPV